MRFLLDEHVSSALASQLRAHGVDAIGIPEWLNGSLLCAGDEELLMAAYQDGRVLVTFDCQTIPHLLRRIAEAGEHHGGVVLVPSRSIRANDVGKLLHALVSLATRRGDEDWVDRVAFLK